MRSRPSSWRRLGLCALVVAAFVVVQVMALSHELEHVAHKHDAPCGFHVAADHLVIVLAPDPAPAAPPALSGGGVSAAPELPPPAPARPGSARAPLFLS